MRKALLIILGIFCIASLFAEPFIKEGDFTVDLFNNIVNNAPTSYTDPSISLGPYNATTGLNMVSKFYPRRNEGDELNYNGSLSSDATLNDGDKDYSNDHIIALGALYDLPLVYKYNDNNPVTSNTTSTGEWKHTDTSAGIKYYEREIIELETKTIKLAILSVSEGHRPAMAFSANSSTDFMFISQSHPTYRRPFQLVIQPKSVTTNYRLNSSHNGYQEGVMGCRILGDGFDNNPSVELSEKNDINFYASFWFDVILALPNSGDIENGVLVTDKNGVQTRYELIEASDYSSVVDLAVRYNPLVYEIYDVSYNKETKYIETGTSSLLADSPSVTWGEEKVAQNDYFKCVFNGEITNGTHQSSVVTIPFSGYYSPYDNGGVESSAAFNVNTYPIISNLSLNPSSSNNPRTFIDIADISLIYLYGGSNNDNWYTRDEIAEGLPCSVSSNMNPRIFLSASSNPKEQNQNGFLFVHRGDTRVVEGVNAVRYIARVTDNKGNISDFDGTDYITDDLKMADGCTGSLLESEHHFTEPFWQTEGNVGGAQKIRVMHYHSYDGTISILIDDTDGNLMQAGAYESTIYVHLITP